MSMVAPNSTLGDGFTCGPYKAPSFSYSGAVGFAPSDMTAPSDMAMVGIQFFNDTAWNQPVGFGTAFSEFFCPELRALWELSESHIVQSYIPYSTLEVFSVEEFITRIYKPHATSKHHSGL